MMDWGTLLDFIGLYLIPGLITGCIYALGAIGVSLLFGILRFAHFAHGDVMTLGGYLALTFVWWLGWPVLAAIPLAMIGTALVAVCLDRAFYRPFRRRPTIISVIASFGVMLMIRSAIQLIWGVEPMQYKAGIERPIILFGQLRLQERHIWMIAITAVLVLALHLMLSRSRIGRAMRAVSDEPDLARVTGISTERVILVTWLVGGALAAVAGVFLGMDSKIDSYMGWDMLLPVFAAAILGGIGSPMGAAAGGLVLGLIEELSTYNWIGDNPLVPPDYKLGLAFAIMVILLIWRPTGLLRGRQF
ncbi:MAG TPA: branched-chain amino acid ABC transporter permease [Verrucomicrobiae bacterium]|nr:branched-chain amino acid ABC transporter permease [Verrucomicrobiae bacterium]